MKIALSTELVQGLILPDGSKVTRRTEAAVFEGTGFKYLDASFYKDAYGQLDYDGWEKDVKALSSDAAKRGFSGGSTRRGN